MHEILTLQLGQRANYLATHFWNTQESYFTYSSEHESLVDHDIHFRPGIGADGNETFTPRTVIYDLKGGFGTLRRLNALYEIEEPTASDALWNGRALIQRQAAIEQSAYQQSLEEGLPPPKLTTESVRYWSDFNRVFYSPKSIVQLNEYELNSGLMPFENWTSGEELFDSLDKEHDLLDRDLRPFAEEADHMQGIQIISGVDDAWGGFASKYMDRLRDEYGKTTVWFWGLEDGITSVPREKRLSKLSNTAKTISEIAPQATLFIPISISSAALPSYVQLATVSQWHVSGLLATALESITLPSRLRAKRVTLGQLASALNVNGNQNIAKLRMSIDQKDAHNGHHRPGRMELQSQSMDARVPSQDHNSSDNIEVKGEETSVFDIDFFPSDMVDHSRGRERSVKKSHVFGEIETYRGEEDDVDEGMYQEDEGPERARRRAAGLRIIHKSSTVLPFPMLDSFPHIYAQSDSPKGLSVKASLSTDTTVALRIKTLQQIVSRAIAFDEREALRNSLGEIAEAYEEGWDGGSDSDDD
ncbi:tubulin domain-containing protein [Calycina marina]|uniref:Tubulin domain-containing protein n=1 Tax=Calycina marina TaxID=1763456 RepID=A0A9P8CHG0_9HELO|nr:tubulin domain-containing protein [Calycina marina]